MKLLLSWPNLYSALHLFPTPWPGCCWISNLMDLNICVLRFHHPNILELAAYFTESEKFCLVYPYMRNGSLFDRLQCVVSHFHYSSCYSNSLTPLGAAETFSESWEPSVHIHTRGQPTLSFPRRQRTSPWINFLLLEDCINTWVTTWCAIWWPKDLLGPYSLLILRVKWVYTNYPYFSDHFLFI